MSPRSRTQTISRWPKKVGGLKSSLLMGTHETVDNKKKRDASTSIGGTITTTTSNMGVHMGITYGTNVNKNYADLYKRLKKSLGLSEVDGDGTVE